MKPYKILFITKDFTNNIERNTVYFSEELSKYSDLTLWYEPGNIQEILDKLNLQPDFILINDMKHTRSPQITGLSSLKFLSALLCTIYIIKQMKEKDTLWITM